VTRGQDLARSLELLRQAVDGPTPEPNPVDQLAALAKTLGGSADVAKNVDATETAAQGQPIETVGRRSNCPRRGNARCGADVNGRCSSCKARVRDHEAIGKTLKTLDVLGVLLANTPDAALGVVAKSRRVEPPGLHHTSQLYRNCRHCEFMGAGMCRRYDWPVDPDEVCKSWIAA
jgi:hypothetical protein